MRELVDVGVLCLMTAGADLDLTRRTLHRILYRMQLMTARTRDVARGVLARGPIVRGVRLVAGETSRVLALRGGLRFGSKDDDFGHIAHAIDVRTPGTVAGLALQAAVPEGAARIVRTGVLGMKDARDTRIVVTSEAGIGSLSAVG